MVTVRYVTCPNQPSGQTKCRAHNAATIIPAARAHADATLGGVWRVGDERSTRETKGTTCVSVDSDRGMREGQVPGTFCHGAWLCGSDGHAKCSVRRAQLHVSSNLAVRWSGAALRTSPGAPLQLEDVVFEILEIRQDGAARLRLSDARRKVIASSDDPATRLRQRRWGSSMISCSPGALQGGVAGELGTRPTARAVHTRRRADGSRTVRYGV